MIVGWDIDGTLCRTPDLDYEDAAAVLAGCEPIPAAVRALQAAVEDGHDVVLITARGPTLRAATLQQAQAWLGAAATNLHVAMRPGLIWDADRMAKDKEAALRRLGVDVYVGDRPEDETAALRAGARFVWAHRVHTYGYAALRGDLQFIAGRRATEEGAPAGTSVDSNGLRRAALRCPSCGKSHVDVGKWATFNHKRHLCAGCRQFFDATEANVGVELTEVIDAY